MTEKKEAIKLKSNKALPDVLAEIKTTLKRPTHNVK